MIPSSVYFRKSNDFLNFQLSFARKTHLNWCQYSHLVMRVRGDGRSYMINISTAGFYDLSWNDVYNYVLFTRGGPYYQLVKVNIILTEYFIAMLVSAPYHQNQMVSILSACTVVQYMQKFILVLCFFPHCVSLALYLTNKCTVIALLDEHFCA